MRRYFVMLLTALSLVNAACDLKEVDYEGECTNCEDKDYIIRNDIDHDVLIVMKDNYEKGKYYEYPIAYGDSFVTFSHGSPFFGNICVFIDDTLKFLSDTENWHYNLETISSYDTLEVGDNYYKLRYVIDEDFYEYAKAHPYTGEW